MNTESSYFTSDLTANTENIRLSIDQPAAYKTNLAIDILGSNAALEINNLHFNFLDVGDRDSVTNIKES